MLFETSTASFKYFSSSLRLLTNCIALPPRTYEGLTTIGKPISSPLNKASLRFFAVALEGCLKFNLFTNSWNLSLSSDLSIASTSVPNIFKPFLDKISASFNGVCPPNWIIIPSGFSISIISSIFSDVIGSKYNLFETS